VRAGSDFVRPFGRPPGLWTEFIGPYTVLGERLFQWPRNGVGRRLRQCGAFSRYFRNGLALRALRICWSTWRGPLPARSAWLPWPSGEPEHWRRAAWSGLGASCRRLARVPNIPISCGRALLCCSAFRFLSAGRWTSHWPSPLRGPYCDHGVRIGRRIRRWGWAAGQGDWSAAMPAGLTRYYRNGRSGSSTVCGCW